MTRFIDAPASAQDALTEFEFHSRAYPGLYATFCDFLDKIENSGLAEPLARGWITVDDLIPPARPRPRKKSITTELQAARRAGATSATVTRPDGVAVTATFAEPVASAPDNSWASAIGALEAKQGRQN